MFLCSMLCTCARCVMLHSAEIHSFNLLSHAFVWVGYSLHVATHPIFTSHFPTAHKQEGQTLLKSQLTRAVQSKPPSNHLFR